MKVRNDIIFNCQEALSKLTSITLPIKPAYEIMKLEKEMKQHIEIINDVRRKLINQYGIKDEETGETFIKQNTPEMAKFIEEFMVILQEETDLNIEKIEFPLNMNGNDVQLEPKVLAMLEPFLEFNDNLS